MRAVGYTRVSTAGQTEGRGLDRQEESIREVAAAHGLDLVTITSDEGVSGTLEAAQRPGLLTCLERIEDERDPVAVLVVEDLSRLARKQGVQEAILDRVWKHGGRVFTRDGEVLEDDPSDPVRTAVRQMLGVMAQLERGLIVKRMQDGRARKLADRNGYVGGRPPYGWRVEGEGREARKVQDPHEQAVIRFALRRVRAGDTVAQVAERLNRERYRTRDGGEWTFQHVYRIREVREARKAVAA